MPFVGAAACMHQNDSATRFGADAGQSRVPGKAADVVDDFSARGEHSVCGGGFVGIDGDHGVGPDGEDTCENRQQSRLLLFGADGRG